VLGMATLNPLPYGTHAVAGIFTLSEEGMRAWVYLVFYHVSVLFKVVFSDDFSELFGL
jgi:uncharacterized ion transporter superfamily protein YfcC